MIRICNYQTLCMFSLSLSVLLVAVGNGHSSDEKLSPGFVSTKDTIAKVKHNGAGKPWTIEFQADDGAAIAQLGSDYHLYSGLPAPDGYSIFQVHEWPNFKPALVIFKSNDPKYTVCRFKNLTQHFRWGIRIVGKQQSPFIFAYDTSRRRQVSFPYQWKAGANCPEILADRAREIRFKGISQIDILQSARFIAGNWFVGAGSELKRYDTEEQNWQVIQSIVDYTIHSIYEEAGLLSLLLRRKTTHPHVNIKGTTAWAKLALSDRPRIESLPNVPAEVDREIGSLAPLTNNETLLPMLHNALNEIDPTDLWDYANNNSEGRISWRQIYLTALYLDLLEFPEYFYLLSSTNTASFEALKTRLEMEWENFIFVQCRANLENYYTPRYSLDRQPFHAAVNIGRIAEMFGRFEVVTGEKLPDTCWNPLIPRLVTLEGTWDEFHQFGQGNSRYMPEKTRFLRRRRDVKFKRDGNNLPFNHVSAWITGLLWAEAAERIELSDMVIATILDEWNLFFTFADVPESKNEPFHWYYTWGYSFHGWGPKDDISSNTPSFDGSRYRASPGYLMKDSQALFGSQLRFPDDYKEEFSSFRANFENAFSEGALGKFGFRHLADWKRYDLNLVMPEPSKILPLLRPVALQEVRGSLWAAATWVNQKYGGEDFEEEAGHAPYLSSTRERRIGEPSGQISAIELLGGREFSDYQNGDTIEVFDAHCGRGFFQKSRKELPDRLISAVPISELSSLLYVMAPRHNQYDEIRIRLRNQFGSSPWRSINMIAKGDKKNDPQDHPRLGWERLKNDCRAPGSSGSSID